MKSRRLIARESLRTCKFARSRSRRWFSFLMRATPCPSSRATARSGPAGSTRKSSARSRPVSLFCGSWPNASKRSSKVLRPRASFPTICGRPFRLPIPPNDSKTFTCRTSPRKKAWPAPPANGASSRWPWPCGTGTRPCPTSRNCCRPASIRKRSLPTVDDVRTGVQHILAEMMAETADVRADVRTLLWETEQGQGRQERQAGRGAGPGVQGLLRVHRARPANSRPSHPRSQSRRKGKCSQGQSRIQPRHHPGFVSEGAGRALADVRHPRAGADWPSQDAKNSGVGSAFGASGSGPRGRQPGNSGACKRRCRNPGTSGACGGGRSACRSGYAADVIGSGGRTSCSRGGRQRTRHGAAGNKCWCRPGNTCDNRGSCAARDRTCSERTTAAERDHVTA